MLRILRCILSGAQNPSKVRAEGSVVCAEPDMLCSSMSLCACVGESSLRGACTPYSAHRACSSRSWRRSPTRTAGSRASSSWSPRSATARAPTGSISRASPTARSCSCRIRRTDLMRRLQSASSSQFFLPVCPSPVVPDIRFPIFKCSNDVLIQLAT